MISRASAAAGVLAVLLLAGCAERPPGRVETPGPAPVEALSARAVHSAVNLPDGTVTVAGGCVVDGCDTATDTVFDLAVDGTISAGPPMLSPRAGHVATVLEDGSVFVAGGFTGEGTAPLASTELRRPGGGWEPSGRLEQGRGGGALALLADGSPVLIGGWLGPRRYTATTEILDLRSGAFRPGPNLPQAADGLAAVTLADGAVLVTGGQVRPNVATSTAVVISPTGNTVTTVGPLRVARFKHTMVLLRSGQVLVIGGTSDDRELLRSTEIFDPRAGTFRAGPPLVNERYKLGGSAAVLPDGRVVVGGGGVGVEVLDVERGTSRLVPAMDDGIASFSSVNVLGDSVVSVGGYDERIRLTRRFQSVPIATL